MSGQIGLKISVQDSASSVFNKIAAQSSKATDSMLGLSGSFLSLSEHQQGVKKISDDVMRKFRETEKIITSFGDGTQRASGRLKELKSALASIKSLSLKGQEREIAGDGSQSVDLSVFAKKNKLNSQFVDDLEKSNSALSQMETKYGSLIAKAEARKAAQGLITLETEREKEAILAMERLRFEHGIGLTGAAREQYGAARGFFSAEEEVDLSPLLAEKNKRIRLLREFERDREAIHAKALVENKRREDVKIRAIESFQQQRYENQKRRDREYLAHVNDINNQIKASHRQKHSAVERSHAKALVENKRRDREAAQQAKAMTDLRNRAKFYNVGQTMSREMSKIASFKRNFNQIFGGRMGGGGLFGSFSTVVTGINQGFSIIDRSMRSVQRVFRNFERFMRGIFNTINRMISRVVGLEPEMREFMSRDVALQVSLRGQLQDSDLARDAFYRIREESRELGRELGISSRVARAGMQEFVAQGVSYESAMRYMELVHDLALSRSPNMAVSVAEMSNVASMLGNIFASEGIGSPNLIPMLRNMGIFLNAQEQATLRSNDLLTTYEALDIVMNAVSRSAGGFTRTIADTPVGQINRLRANFEDLRVAIGDTGMVWGGAIAATINSFFPDTQRIDEMLRNATTFVYTNLPRVATQVTGVVSNIVTSVRDFGSNMFSMVRDNLGNILQVAFLGISAKLVSLGAIIVPVISVLSTVGGAISMFGGQALSGITDVRSFAGALRGVVTTMFEFGRGLSSTMFGFGQTVAVVVQNIAGVLTPILNVFSIGGNTMAETMGILVGKFIALTTATKAVVGVMTAWKVAKGISATLKEVGNVLLAKYNVAKAKAIVLSGGAAATNLAMGAVQNIGATATVGGFMAGAKKAVAGVGWSGALAAVGKGALKVALGPIGIAIGGVALATTAASAITRTRTEEMTDSFGFLGDGMGYVTGLIYELTGGLVGSVSQNTDEMYKELYKQARLTNLFLQTQYNDYYQAYQELLSLYKKRRSQGLDMMGSYVQMSLVMARDAYKSAETALAEHNAVMLSKQAAYFQSVQNAANSILLSRSSSLVSGRDRFGNYLEGERALRYQMEGGYLREKTWYERLAENLENFNRDFGIERYLTGPIPNINDILMTEEQGQIEIRERSLQKLSRLALARYAREYRRPNWALSINVQDTVVRETADYEEFVHYLCKEMHDAVENDASMNYVDMDIYAGAF